MKRLLAVVLAMASVLCMATVCFGASDPAAPVKQDIVYDELVGRVSQSDSGFTEQSTYIYSGGRTSMAPRNDSGFQFYYLGLENWSGGFIPKGASEPPYEDAPLPDWYLEFLTQTLANLRANGGACIIRGTYALNGENRAEPTTIAMLHTHQKQLAKVFNMFPEVILAVECGMAGAYGEMHSGKYSGQNDKCAILMTWLDELDPQITVNVRTTGEYFRLLQVSPLYGEKFANKTVNGITYPSKITPMNCHLYAFEGEYFGRIGVYNDAMIQDGNDGGSFDFTNAGGRETFRLFLQSRAKQVTYGGEFSGADVYRFAGSDKLTGDPSTWMPMNAIPEFYKTHLTYYHGGNRAYVFTGRFKYSNTFSGVSFASEAARDEQLERIRATFEKSGCGMPFAFANLKESNGRYQVDITTGGWDNAIVNDALIQEIGKSTALSADLSAYKGQSVASFFEDHIGYRIVLKESYITGSTQRGGTISVRGTVDNTGFSNILRNYVTELVITNGKDTYTVRTDIDAKNWVSASRNSYSAAIKLPSGIPAGEYTVYLRVAVVDDAGDIYEKSCIPFANPGQFAYKVHATGAFDNSAVTHQTIYNSQICGNYIGKFTVTDEVKQDSDNTIAQVGAFKDVTIKHWAKDEVTEISALGYMNGTGNGFEPDANTARAMLAQVLYNMEGKPDVSGIANPFSDVPDGQWYTDAVKWAAANGIVNGTGDGKFSPNANIKREELATMLYRYAKEYKKIDIGAAGDLSAYPDANKVNDWALDALKWANGAGIVNGMGTGIVPQGLATRAQMATMLMRYLKTF